MNYYNEFDPGAAEWLRNLIAAGLIPAGKVDTRSIKDVAPSDLDGFVQCHFFAGLGGWPLALRIAGWPDDREIWTGSCPCQPYSSAGKGEGDADPRNLWPDFFRLIKARKPVVVCGEQVASAEVVGSQLEADFVDAVQKSDYARANRIAKRLVAKKDFSYRPRWVDRVCADLETVDYSFWFSVLGAHSVRAPHMRQRLWWLADSTIIGRQEHERRARPHQKPHATNSCGGFGGLDNGVALGDTELARSQGSADGSNAPLGHGEAARGSVGFSGGADRWGNFALVHCSDGKSRRFEPGSFPLAHGVPRELGRGQPELFRLARRARANRVARLKGYGNAIVPELAAEFIRAWMETEGAA